MNQILSFSVTLVSLLACLLPLQTSAQIDCPDTMWAEGDNCLWFFEVGNFQTGEVVIWNFNDQDTVAGGHFNQYQFAEDGMQTVCANYTSDLCPQGVDVCVDVIVEGCEDSMVDCAFEVLVEDDSLGVVTVIPLGLGDIDGESGQWVFILNGEIVAENAASYEVSADLLGTAWELCVQYVSDNCPDGVVECVGPGAGDGGQGCPQEIWVSGAGCEYLSSVCNFTEGESVEWTYSDGTSGTGHFDAHLFEESGAYTICAYYTSPACLDGITLCEEVLVEGCGGDVAECGLELIVESSPIDGGGMFNGYSVTATGFSNDVGLNWVVNGEPAQAGGFNPNILMLTGDDFPYTVCAWYETSDCGQQEACVTIVGNSGGEDCFGGSIDSVEVWDCYGWFHLALDAGVEITSAHWDFGDGSVSNNFDWSAHHSYEATGWYLVCATVFTEDCAEGVEICEEVYIEGCEDDDCIHVNFAVDWLGGLLEGYPQDVNWYLTGNSTSLMGPLEFGESPHWDYSICLEPGCYQFGLYATDGDLDEENLFMAAFVQNEQIEYVAGPDWYGGEAWYDFAVGDADCGDDPQVDCTLEVEVTPIAGGFLYEAITNDLEATFVWTFTNGEILEGNPVEVLFDDPAFAAAGCVVAVMPMCDGEELLVCFTEELEDACEDVLIVLNLADLTNGGIQLTGELLWLLSGDLFDISGLWDLADDAAGEIELCVPAGCYEIFLDFDASFLPPAIVEMLAFTWSIDSVEMGTVSVEPVDEGLLATFAILEDCTDGVAADAGIGEAVNPSLYPNPATDRLTIAGLHPTYLGSAWTLFDAHGRTVRAGAIQSSERLEIDVADLSEGLYTLQVGSGMKAENLRVAIVR
jgi:hypothetical protein